MHDTVNTFVCSSLGNWVISFFFFSSRSDIKQSDHHNGRPGIYSTIRVVVVLMGPSISLCEGRANTCTIINTGIADVPPLDSCFGGLGLAGGSWELAVFQQWSEHVRKCAYTEATHAGSTILQRVAVLQRLRRLQIKHTITCMEPCGDSASEGCDGAPKSPGYLLFVYAGVLPGFSCIGIALRLLHHRG